MEYATKETYDALSTLLFDRQNMVARHARERIGTVMSLDSRIALQRAQKAERLPLDAAIEELLS